MSMRFEAAVITKKRVGEEFNTDSVNINGKILPREIILNGYKGAGVIDDKAYFALNSSFVEGYSDASVASFEDFAVHFNEKSTTPITIINEYFRNTVSAINSLNHTSKEISIGAAYCGKRNVILGRSGDTSLYSYSGGILKKINPENSMHDDAKSNYGCYTIHDVTVNDIFLLISPGASASLSDKDIADICRVSDGSVKKIVNIIARVAEAKLSSGGIGVIAIKILLNDLTVDDEADEMIEQTDVPDMSVTDTDAEKAPELPKEHEEIVGGFVPAFEFDIQTDKDEIVFEDSNSSQNNEKEPVEEIVSQDNEKKSKKIGLIGLIVVAIVIIAGVLFGVAKFTDIFNYNRESSTSLENITETEITTEESTTAEETTEEETTEVTTEETTEETTTVRTTYYYTYTQKSTSSTTTEATTAAQTTEPTTARETTTKHTATVPSTTKKTEEKTTKQEKTTSSESTTKSSDKTEKEDTSSESSTVAESTTISENSTVAEVSLDTGSGEETESNSMDEDE